jgi:glutaminase
MKKWLNNGNVNDSINYIRVKENEVDSLSIDVYEESTFIISFGEKEMSFTKEEMIKFYDFLDKYYGN